MGQGVAPVGAVPGCPTGLFGEGWLGTLQTHLPSLNQLHLRGTGRGQSLPRHTVSLPQAVPGGVTKVVGEDLVGVSKR